MTGVLPLGAFLILHLVRWSPLGSSAAPPFAAPAGLVLGASALLVWLPLAYHAAYGVACSLGVVAAPEAGPRARRFCRISGPLVLSFVLLHAVDFSVPLWTGAIAPDDLHGRLCDLLASTGSSDVPWRAVAYLAGAALTVTHFAVGCYSLCRRWPRLTARCSDRSLRLACAVLAVALYGAAAGSILYFATGGVGSRS